MILTAQHVQSRSGVEGVNSFCRIHGPYEWTTPPEDLLSGELVNREIMVPLGGNSVRSYLDIITPDETPTHEIRNAVVQFLNQSQGQPFPWLGTVGRCTFRFGLELGLYNKWSAEFHQLLLSALAVRRAA